MAYRDADAATLARRRALTDQLDRTIDEAERETIGREVQAIDASRLDAARKRLPLVANARVASPCAERWDTMLGSGAVRACSRCDKEVFDLSQMTLGEAEALLDARASSGMCVRIHRRTDGTMMFADCEVGARGVVRRRLSIAGAAILASGSALAWAQPDPPMPAEQHWATPADGLRAAEAFLHPQSGLGAYVTGDVEALHDELIAPAPRSALRAPRWQPGFVVIDGPDEARVRWGLAREYGRWRYRLRRMREEYIRQSGADLDGHVIVRATTAPHARLANIVVTENTTRSRAMAAEIARITRRVRLPVEPIGTVTYEVHFEFGGGE